MEGIGIASCCEPYKLDWIIVKGICDFADGNKNRNKKRFQQIASHNAVSYCKSVLSEPHILDELGIVAMPDDIHKSHEINEVLFKTYKVEVEPYYLTRLDDGLFKSFISNYSIWLHGESGTGKSTLIVRNLTLTGFQLIQINLASASEYSLVSILKDIYLNLSIYFNLGENAKCYNAVQELIDSISNLIIKHFDFSKHIIYLDEIPEYQTDGVFEQFVKALYAINANVQNKVANVKSVFVLSSITSAKKYLHGSQAKMSESFKFMQLGLWLEKDILILTELINERLSLKFKNEEVISIVQVSNGIPRNVKRIVRDYISTLSNENYNLPRILAETAEENR